MPNKTDSVMVEMVLDCLSDMTPAGRRGIEDLMHQFIANYKWLPRAKAFGPLMGYELIGCLVRYLALPESKKRELSRFHRYVPRNVKVPSSSTIAPKTGSVTK